MKAQPKAIHVVLILCSWLAAGLPQLSESLPEDASYFKLAAAALAVLTGMLGAYSGSAFKPKDGSQ